MTSTCNRTEWIFPAVAVTGDKSSPRAHYRVHFSTPSFSSPFLAAREREEGAGRWEKGGGKKGRKGRGKGTRDRKKVADREREREREKRYPHPERGRGTGTRARRAGSGCLRFSVSVRGPVPRARKNATGMVNFARAGEHVTIQD